jgi:coenzyme F420-reducing hydrogenase delta subunit
MNEFSPKIVAFCCSNCASAAAGVAGRTGMSLPPNVSIVRVPCTGRLEVLHLLKPFEEGADGVYVAGCQEDSCRYITGVVKAAKRVAHVKKILEEIGLEPERIEIFNMSAASGRNFVQTAVEMTERLQAIGPLSTDVNTNSERGAQS